MLLLSDAEFHATLWPVLTLGTLALATDQLSAFFLFVTGLMYPTGVDLLRHLSDKVPRVP